MAINEAATDREVLIMNAVIWLMILGLMLNGTIGMVQLAFGTTLVHNGGLIPLDDIIASQKALANNASANGGLTLSLSFGDFLKGAQFVLNAITLQYFADVVEAVLQAVDVMEGSGAQVALLFIYTIRGVLAVIGVFTLWYMITGRGSQQNV